MGRNFPGGMAYGLISSTATRRCDYALVLKWRQLGNEAVAACRAIVGRTQFKGKASRRDLRIRDAIRQISHQASANVFGLGDIQPALRVGDPVDAGSRRRLPLNGGGSEDAPKTIYERQDGGFFLVAASLPSGWPSAARGGTDAWIRIQLAKGRGSGAPS